MNGALDKRNKLTIGIKKELPTWACLSLLGLSAEEKSEREKRLSTEVIF